MNTGLAYRNAGQTERPNAVILETSRKAYEDTKQLLGPMHPTSLSTSSRWLVRRVRIEWLRRDEMLRSRCVLAGHQVAKPGIVRGDGIRLGVRLGNGRTRPRERLMVSGPSARCLA